MNDQSTQKASQNTEEQPSVTDRIVDPKDLVCTSSYSEEEGSISDNPREIISNPAVAPEMLDTTSQDLRDDIFKESSEA
jgi:hypothetical protein